MLGSTRSRMGLGTSRTRIKNKELRIIKFLIDLISNLPKLRHQKTIDEIPNARRPERDLVNNKVKNNEMKIPRFVQYLTPNPSPNLGEGERKGVRYESGTKISATMYAASQLGWPSVAKIRVCTSWTQQETLNEPVVKRQETETPKCSKLP